MGKQTHLYFETLDRLEESAVKRRWFDFDKECGQIAIDPSTFAIFSAAGSYVRGNGREQIIETGDSVSQFINEQNSTDE